MTVLTRRSFFRAAGLAGLALPGWFPRLAFSATPSPQRDVLVAVFLRGAADGLNIVVPFGDRDYYANRPTLGIGEPSATAGTAIDLDGFFGLHPALAPLEELYGDKALAVVHAAGSPDDTHSHFTAMDFMERGTPGSKSLTTGWIGRHLASLDTGNESPFRAVGIGHGVPASLRGPVPAAALKSIADFHLKGLRSAAELSSFQAGLSNLYPGGDFLDSQARQTFDAVALLATANPGAYQPQNGAQYPDSDFGQALQQVAQLLRADLGLEVACVDVGGWDTHAAEEGTLAGLLADLGAGLHAFYADLADRMAHITVVTLSEFGRRVKENASGGTDHGHGNCMFLLGGGVAGGKVYGAWPGLAAGQLYGPGDLAVTTDFRTVLSEIVDHRLGNSKIAEVFPGFERPAYLGLARQSV